MRALIPGIIFAIALSACSFPVLVKHEQSPPARVLDDFFSAVSDKRYSDTLEKFSTNRLRDIKEDVLTQQDVDNYFDALSTFRLAIVNKIGSYEEIRSESACLTTAGYNRKGEPVSLNVSFALEKELWKIDYLHAIFHQSQQELPSKATCSPPEQ